MESLSGIPNVTSIIETSRDYDLQATALVADIEQVFTIQDKITSIAGITRIEASAKRISEKWSTPFKVTAKLNFFNLINNPGRALE